MEQLVILVIIGLISLVNWLMKRSAELKEQRRIEKAAQQGDYVPPRPPVTGPPPLDVDPSESMRKLMEALGLPMEAPEPIQKIPQPRTPLPPPIVEEFAPRPRTDYAQMQAPKPARKAFVPAPARNAPGYHSAAAIVESKKPSRFRTLLSSPDGIRNAIVLTEILGKPRGIKPI